MIGIVMSYQNMKKQKENQYKQKIERVIRVTKSGDSDFGVLTIFKKSLYFKYIKIFFMETRTKTVRLNSEKTINHELFKIKIGTTNKINPKVIYIEGRTFIQPLNDKSSYSVELTGIKRGFNKIIQNFIDSDDLFSKKYILDFQVAQSGISVTKRSFLSFQFLLKQKNEDKILKLKEVKQKTESNIQNILNLLTQCIKEYDFNVTKTKR